MSVFEWWDKYSLWQLFKIPKILLTQSINIYMHLSLDFDY